MFHYLFFYFLNYSEHQNYDNFMRLMPFDINDMLSIVWIYESSYLRLVQLESIIFFPENFMRSRFFRPSCSCPSLPPQWIVFLPSLIMFLVICIICSLQQIRISNLELRLTEAERGLQVSRWAVINSSISSLPLPSFCSSQIWPFLWPFKYLSSLCNRPASPALYPFLCPFAYSLLLLHLS